MKGLSRGFLKKSRTFFHYLCYSPLLWLVSVPSHEPNRTWMASPKEIDFMAIGWQFASVSVVHSAWCFRRRGSPLDGFIIPHFVEFVKRFFWGVGFFLSSTFCGQCPVLSLQPSVLSEEMATSPHTLWAVTHLCPSLTPLLYHIVCGLSRGFLKLFSRNSVCRKGRTVTALTVKVRPWTQSLLGLVPLPLTTIYYHIWPQISRWNIAQIRDKIFV